MDWQCVYKAVCNGLASNLEPSVLKKGSTAALSKKQQQKKKQDKSSYIRTVQWAQSTVQCGKCPIWYTMFVWKQNIFDSRPLIS